jgi:hypothetical protein
LSQIALSPHGGRASHPTWGRKDEEYIADFCLVSRRALDDFEYKLFRYHFLLGADWKLCSRRLGLDRGNFFHAVYRVEQKLGRVFRELQPYPLYPLDEYFHGAVRMCAAIALAPQPHGPPTLPLHLRFPVVAQIA